MSIAIIFPEINPSIINIYGPIAIRWYSLAYIAGILIGINYIKILSKNFIDIKNEIYDNMITYVVLGIIIGGRIGYILFYDISEYIKHPLDMFKLWNGGMSFHGGMIGLVISMILFCRKYKLDFFNLSDLIACSAPIGIFFGRIANFINGELYGRITDLPWGVIFPGENFARHPSQIYESISEGLLCFIILNILFFRTNIKYRKFSLSGLFLIIYSISRIIIEFYREPDSHIGYIFNYFTTGQLLCVPMLICGIIFTNIFKKK